MHYRVIYIYSAKPRLNKTVLRRRLKDVVVDRWSLMSIGRLFHTRGAATANARSPNLLRVRGIYRSPLSAVRNEARDGRSATVRVSAAKTCDVVRKCRDSWTSQNFTPTNQPEKARRAKLLRQWRGKNSSRQLKDRKYCRD